MKGKIMKTHYSRVISSFYKMLFVQIKYNDVVKGITEVKKIELGRYQTSIT